MLPTFFVIGAPKCGTTSLHSDLDRHPSISMSRVKEPWVFARPDYEERVGEYDGLFDGGAAVRGESSAVYALHPHFPGVPERIAEVVPDARFVYLVRDPIERAISHHAQLVTDGKEKRPLEQALLADDEPANVYVAASSYATQLQLYLSIWPGDRILVLEQAALLARPEETMPRVFDFLGVDPALWPKREQTVINTREEHRVRTSLGERIGSSRPAGAIRRAPLPELARRPLRRLLSRGMGRPELDVQTREALAERLRDEVEWLREFTGLALEGWLE